jgi:hypothetical protein
MYLSVLMLPHNPAADKAHAGYALKRLPMAIAISRIISLSESYVVLLAGLVLNATLLAQILVFDCAWECLSKCQCFHVAFCYVALQAWC